MRVLLIDVDSTIPNLALMKISSYHKSKGDVVGFKVNNPDLVYASVIFKKNKHKVDGLRFLYPNAEIDIGGSGYDLKKKLPEVIENMRADYDLYPDCDRFYGFTTRGCIRKCPFCIVPEKEGKIRQLYHSAHYAIEEITAKNPKRFDQIEFLDNNILARRTWFLKLCGALSCSYPHLKVDFNQGLDIRLVDDRIAEELSKLKPITCWKFAFDNTDYQDKVERGIEILKRNNVNVRHSVMFYVYVDNDGMFDDALYRCQWLKDHGATPYIMLNQDVKHSRRMKDLKRWCRPWIFWSSSYQDYKKKVLA